MQAELKILNETRRNPPLMCLWGKWPRKMSMWLNSGKEAILPTLIGADDMVAIPKTPTVLLDIHDFFSLVSKIALTAHCHNLFICQSRAHVLVIFKCITKLVSVSNQWSEWTHKKAWDYGWTTSGRTHTELGRINLESVCRWLFVS